MILTPEGCQAVIAQVNLEALAENIAEQLGGGDLTVESFDTLRDRVHDGLIEALAIDFEVIY